MTFPNFAKPPILFSRRHISQSATLPEFANPLGVGWDGGDHDPVTPAWSILIPRKAKFLYIWRTLRLPPPQKGIRRPSFTNKLPHTS